MRSRILWITQTALFIALLIVAQFATAQLGNQYITGSIVNLLLIVSTIMCGFASGMTVAMVSPILARLLGIGPPFWPLVPFIALGNLALVALWHIAVTQLPRFGGIFKDKKVFYPIAVVVAALWKFVVLYVGIVRFAAPVILKLPPNAPVLLAFSFPQFITACIGGALAIAVIPLVKRAYKR